MIGGYVFRHVDKDKFLVKNTGQSRDFTEPMIVKLLAKDLKYILNLYKIETKKMKKEELLTAFKRLINELPIVHKDNKKKTVRKSKPVIHKENIQKYFKG